MIKCPGRSCDSENSIIRWCELEPDPSHDVINTARIEFKVGECSNSVVSLRNSIAGNGNGIFATVVRRAGNILQKQKCVQNVTATSAIQVPSLVIQVQKLTVIPMVNVPTSENNESPVTKI